MTRPGVAVARYIYQVSPDLSPVRRHFLPKQFLLENYQSRAYYRIKLSNMLLVLARVFDLPQSKFTMTGAPKLLTNQKVFRISPTIGALPL